MLIGLGTICALVWGATGYVALTRDGDGDDDVVGINPADLLSDEQLELIHRAEPDPSCASEATAPPDDDSLVALDVLRVEGTCLDATTEHVPADEVDRRRAELDDDPSVVAAGVAPPATAASLSLPTRADAVTSADAASPTGARRVAGSPRPRDAAPSPALPGPLHDVHAAGSVDAVGTTAVPHAAVSTASVDVVAAQDTAGAPTQADDRREDQWALDALGAPEGSADLPWPDGTGVMVAVLDTGVDAAHPDLTDAVVGRRRYPGEGELDPDGHGTAVAGIIGARGDNGGTIGVTPAVGILDVPVTLDGAEENPDSWLVGLPWAVNNGASVANLSLGSAYSEWQKPEYQGALEFAAAAVEFARHNDVVVVAAVGNCGPELLAASCDEDNQREVPAALADVVSVGAVQKDHDLAGYSTRNEDVDLLAPGGGIADDMVLSTAPGGEYVGFNGSSAAAPHVAAAAAALRSAVPDATDDDIGRALIETAERDWVSERDRDRVGVGHGFVDILGAIDQVGSVRPEPEEDLTDRTQAAYVHHGTLYVFDGTTTHPVREVGSDHTLASIVWSDDHGTLVGADEATLFSWAGEGSEVVERSCEGCARNEIAYLDDAAVVESADSGQTRDLVVTVADDGTLTRYDAHTLEPEGTAPLEPAAEPGVGSDNMAILMGDAQGSLLVQTTGGVSGVDTLWQVDPSTGQSDASHEVVGDWGGRLTVNAAGDLIAYASSGASGGTCDDVQEAIVLDGADLTPVADPDLPRHHVFDEIFFNGDTLYATLTRIEVDSQGRCPDTGSAGLWRVDGDGWHQVDSTPMATARPLEGMTGEVPAGWLIVTEDEEGFIVPRPLGRMGEGELGRIDLGSFTFLGLWATPTRSEVPRSEESGSGGTTPGGGGDDEGGNGEGGGGGGSSLETVEGAIARYEQLLHALGEGDLDTVCTISAPAMEQAGMGDDCEAAFQITLDMISEEQGQALRTATVDPDRVEALEDGAVRIPSAAIVASVAFAEEDLGTRTLRHQDGDWFIVD